MSGNNLGLSLKCGDALFSLQSCMLNALVLPGQGHMAKTTCPLLQAPKEETKHKSGAWSAPCHAQNCHILKPWIRWLPAGSHCSGT